MKKNRNFVNHHPRLKANASNVVHYDGTFYKYLSKNQSFSGVLIDEDGDKFWYRNGKLHREDGPALIVRRDNTEHWYIKGKSVTEKEWKIYQRGKKLEVFLND